MRIYICRSFPLGHPSNRHRSNFHFHKSRLLSLLSSRFWVRLRIAPRCWRCKPQFRWTNLGAIPHSSSRHLSNDICLFQSAGSIFYKKHLAKNGNLWEMTFIFCSLAVILDFVRGDQLTHRVVYKFFKKFFYYKFLFVYELFSLFFQNLAFS